MIIIRLSDGLGNQMFQYAAGRRLAHIHTTDLYLDLTSFSSNSVRNYRLDKFRIHAKIASPDLLKQVPISFSDTIRIGIKNWYTHEAGFHIVREPSFAFDKMVLSLPDRVCLEGFWQSEKYFQDIRGIINQEFCFKKDPDDANQRLIEHIQTTESVSLHIRRGDYVSIPANNSVHGTCSLDYYRIALESLTKTVKRPHIFIFSDDPEWVRKNFNLAHPSTLVEINGTKQDYEDLRLMSLCNHHIIANSTFSWWGAWLCKSPDKQIYAPGKWFNSSAHDTKDLIPDGWHTI
jgi:hypothetical protein